MNDFFKFIGHLLLWGGLLLAGLLIPAQIQRGSGTGVPDAVAALQVSGVGALIAILGVLGDIAKSKEPPRGSQELPPLKGR